MLQSGQKCIYLYHNKRTKNMKKQIIANTTLSTRSICDHDCIFSLTVLERKGNFAIINYDGKIRRTRVRVRFDGNEYLRPDIYSMSPIFSAE